MVNTFRRKEGVFCAGNIKRLEKRLDIGKSRKRKDL